MNKELLSTFAIGFLFALGLGISGMTDPSKVIGFLDITGDWDPTLLFVMAGAVTVHFISYRLIKRKTSPLLSPDWHLPTKRDVTPSLVIGAVIFGAGWGLAGYCPGPALTSTASFQLTPIMFVVAMMSGMMIRNLFDSKFIK
jgi:uncharacterized protein